jgi:hypothetical protein
VASTSSAIISYAELVIISPAELGISLEIVVSSAL